jgi:hypothetical protein
MLAAALQRKRSRRIRANGYAGLLLKISHSSTEMLEGQQIRRFVRAATLLRPFSVSQMFKPD